MRLNHLMLTVGDLAQSTDWYVSKPGLKVEFEVPDIKFAALRG
jgi:catechol 2,3-dioxygenase-like lactoylglutathione lyase family enzyme